jgi:hypothetical protein
VGVRKYVIIRTQRGILHPAWRRGRVIVSDVDRYVIIRNVLGSIFSILPVFIIQWEIQKYFMGFSFRKIAYAIYVYDVPQLIEQMDFARPVGCGPSASSRRRE